MAGRPWRHDEFHSSSETTNRLKPVPRYRRLSALQRTFCLKHWFLTNGWEQVLAIEETVSKAELKELLQGMLDPETHLVPVIAEKMAAYPFDVMFITGVGEVFPYIPTPHSSHVSS